MRYVCETCDFTTDEEAAAVSHAESHLNVRMERDTTGRDAEVADYRCGKDDVAGMIHGLLRIYPDAATAGAGEAERLERAAAAAVVSAPAAPVLSTAERVQQAVTQGLEEPADTPGDPADKPL